MSNAYTMAMSKAYTLRLDEKRMKALQHLSIEENRSIRDILEGLLDQYFEAHRETLDLLSRRGFLRSVLDSSKAARSGEKGTPLNALDH